MGENGQSPPVPNNQEQRNESWLLVYNRLSQEQENLARLASGGRKGRGKRGGGHPTRWRRIADGKQQSNKQYTPCQCNSICGKDCPCLNNSTYCEKYCGEYHFEFISCKTTCERRISFRISYCHVTTKSPFHLLLRCHLQYFKM
ncbi:hypothetical protein L1987_21715 [Smallanthus sonchifolius]|uniref:Uncharacterized protein n=1 Tax=Smallanthus sonchifolius TaxID=185202 RepID=A0ACB9IDT8_9ASTR|nr:hypothetical protein L1987_21715 [Smallanthus sonchifolius]